MRITPGLLAFLFFLLSMSSELMGMDGEKLFQGKLCHSCHGLKGVPVSKRHPELAGKNKDYLVVRIENIVSGKRSTKRALIMSANTIIKTLTKEEIDAIASYLSMLP